jgi:hypothetical protein
MEDKFIAAVGVLLPTRKFIVDGERNAFFVAVPSISRKTDDVTVGLQTEGHIEIFRNGVLGPVLFVAIFVRVADMLNGRPAEYGVVPDKRGNITIRDGKFNSSIDQVSEKPARESVVQQRDKGFSR